MSHYYRIGATLPDKPYTVRAVGGMLDGKSRGPYSAYELDQLYAKYKDKIGSIWVRKVAVYRFGILFFTFPDDGSRDDFMRKHIAAVKKQPSPKEEVPPDPMPVPPATEDKGAAAKMVGGLLMFGGLLFLAVKAKR